MQIDAHNADTHCRGRFIVPIADYEFSRNTQEICRGRFIVPIADYEFSRNTQEICRGRFIAPTADLSALGQLCDIPIHSLNFIIGPYNFFRHAADELPWFLNKKED